MVYQFIYQSIFVTICGRLRISISENWIIRALSGCFEIQVVKNHELVGKKRKNSLNRVRRNEKPSFDRRGFLFVRAFECGRLVRSCFVSFSFCFSFFKCSYLLAPSSSISLLVSSSSSSSSSSTRRMPKKADNRAKKKDERNGRT